jgi:hypothetical protein
MGTTFDRNDINDRTSRMNRRNENLMLKASEALIAWNGNDSRGDWSDIGIVRAPRLAA